MRAVICLAGAAVGALLAGAVAFVAVVLNDADQQRRHR